MNLPLHLSLCGVLIVLYVAVGLYRKYLDDHGDHYIHLHDDSHDSTIVSSQTVIIRRLGTLDRLKNGLLVAVILYALAIAAIATYMAWNNPGT